MSQVVDLRNEGAFAAVRLFAPVCSRVGYQVPGFMASDLRREMMCSVGKMERFLSECAVRRGIEDVTSGAEQPRGQLIVVIFPVEREGSAAFTPHLYELPWMAPAADSGTILRQMRQMINQPRGVPVPNRASHGHGLALVGKVSAIAELESELRTCPGPSFSRQILETALRNVATGNVTRDDVRLQPDGVYMLTASGALQTILWSASEPDAPPKMIALAAIIRRAMDDLHLVN